MNAYQKKVHEALQRADGNRKVVAEELRVPISLLTQQINKCKGLKRNWSVKAMDARQRALERVQNSPTNIETAVKATMEEALKATGCSDADVTRNMALQNLQMNFYAESAGLIGGTSIANTLKLNGHLEVLYQERAALAEALKTIIDPDTRLATQELISEKDKHINDFTKTYLTAHKNTEEALLRKTIAADKARTRHIEKRYAESERRKPGFNPLKAAKKVTQTPIIDVEQS